MWKEKGIGVGIRGGQSGGEVILVHRGYWREYGGGWRGVREVIGMERRYR